MGYSHRLEPLSLWHYYQRQRIKHCKRSNTITHRNGYIKSIEIKFNHKIERRKKERKRSERTNEKQVIDDSNGGGHNANVATDKYQQQQQSYIEIAYSSSASSMCYLHIDLSVCVCVCDSKESRLHHHTAIKYLSMVRFYCETQQRRPSKTVTAPNGTAPIAAYTFTFALVMQELSKSTKIVFCIITTRHNNRKT